MHNYQIAEKHLSFGKLGVLGMQHVLAMTAGTILVPLVLGAALGLSKQDLSYLISADFFTCGIATILQAKGFTRFIGIRLPVVMGCSSVAIIPMIIIGKVYGITAIYGAIIISGLLILLIAPLFHIIRKLFPPVVLGSVITIIGLSLILVAIKNIFGSANAVAVNIKENLFFASLVLVFIVIINKYCHGFLQTISVLLGLLFGTLVAYFFGAVNLSFLSSTDVNWFRIIKPFYFGTPQFNINAIAAVCMASFVNMIDSIGVFLILGKICEREITPKDIVAGFRAEGIAQILGGVFNAFPYITFSQNVGLVVLTHIKSRYVVIIAGCILILFGCVPKIAAVITIIPPAVLAGAMLVLFGLVTATGMRILAAVNLTNRYNLLIIGAAISVGLACTIFSSVFANMATWIRIFFSNGIIVGSLLAVFLNLSFNGIQSDS